MAYITIADMRGLGLTNPPYTDAYIQSRITIAEKMFNGCTRMFFEERVSYTIKMDGTGHDMLFLPVPPVTVDSIDSLTYNDTVLVQDTDFEVIMPEIPDGRYNPSIRLLAAEGKFIKGKSNITIVGTFGFVDRVSDGQGGYTSETPEIVKDAVKRMIQLYLPNIIDAEESKVNRIISESLNNYSYQLEDSRARGAFADEYINRAIAMFHKTIAMKI